MTASNSLRESSRKRASAADGPYFGWQRPLNSELPETGHLNDLVLHFSSSLSMSEPSSVVRRK